MAALLCAGVAASASAAQDCRALTVAAALCAENGLRFASAPPRSDTGARLIDMRLDALGHGAVSLIFIAHGADQPLGTLAGYTSGYLETLPSRGATLAELYEFRHRRARSVAQQFTALHPGPGSGRFWAVAIGVEVSDGLVMVLVTTDQQADATTRADWTQIALDALYPRRPE